MSKTMNINEELNEKLKEIINELEEVFSEEEDCSEIFENIPEELWRDRYCSLTIIEKIFENSEYLEGYYAPCELIPDYFWYDLDNARAAIRYIGYDSDKFNINEIFPNSFFSNKVMLKEIVEYNYDGLYYASDELRGDPSIILTALSNLEEKIELRNEECTDDWHISPLDAREELEKLLELVSDTLKSDKEFILEFLEHDYFIDEFDILYNWIDEKLWDDQDFVIDVLKIDTDAFEYISDSLISNEEFIKRVVEETDMDIEDIKNWL